MKDSAPYAHPSTGDDTIEACYSGLERLQPHGCYSGKVFIGHLEVAEEGEEVVIEAVPCRRCNPR